MFLPIQAATNTPADGKITLHYDDGAKMGIKEYKDGQPIGTWMTWYKDGKVRDRIVFQVVSSDKIRLKTGKFTSAIVDVESRYPNEANSIRFKGVSLHLNYLTTQIDGENIHFPTWTHLIEIYNEDGSIMETGAAKTYGIEDSLTGATYTIPWVLE